MKKIKLVLVVVASFTLIAGTIDLANLDNYSAQSIPNYITKDNTGSNSITDAGATLGRVLFYDKNLSANNLIACASCHKQEFAFSDTATRSVGLHGGLTGRHSMRLINSRFSDEVKFFWDERAASLEDQTTMPIQDHVEMGFSGTNGDPDFDSLIIKLESIDYYQPLFTAAYGNALISEERIQNALAQFIRSIQSFDSKFDEGRALVNNNNQNFPNFSAAENAGKQLFLDPPPAGGAGCAGCHRPPEFDIDPASGNNGITGIAGNPSGSDYTNTRAPTLRDLINPDGTLNGPMMHTGNITNLSQLIEHYNEVPIDPINPNLDNRLAGPGGDLQLTANQKSNLIAFLATLTGNDVYTNLIWSNPFDSEGNLTITGDFTSVNEELNDAAFKLYPNPVHSIFQVTAPSGRSWFGKIYSIDGRLVMQFNSSDHAVNISTLRKGVYLVVITSASEKIFSERLVKL